MTGSKDFKNMDKHFYQQHFWLVLCLGSSFNDRPLVKLTTHHNEDRREITGSALSPGGRQLYQGPQVPPCQPPEPGPVPGPEVKLLEPRGQGPRLPSLRPLLL